MDNDFATGYALGADSNGGGNNGNGGGFGWGGDWIWAFLIFALFGWGNGGWGGGFGGGSSSTQGALTRGDLCMDMNFQELANGVRNVNDAVSLGFANLNSTICAQQYDTAGLINSMNMANMQNFNSANIVALQNQNALQAQLSDCCCQTQRAIDGVNYNMATNTNALQVSMANNTRDIIDSQNAGTRAILDYLCQEKISTLQNENQSLRLAASQAAQNQYLVNTLRPIAQPAYITCNPYTGLYGGYQYGNQGCSGCGC